MLNLIRDKKRRHVLVMGGRRENTCDNGLYKRPFEGKTSNKLSWKVKVMKKNKYIRTVP